eukprot:GHVN01077697.1.p1 GENE.GHVN01077697.1~~GHVN01077697.1.p1  ORF type:complete len:863 (+),score=92.95 GHVN01077697.1:281-2590(+)
MILTYQYDQLGQRAWGSFSFFLKHLCSAGNLGPSGGTSLLPAITTTCLLGFTLFTFPYYWRRQTVLCKAADKEAEHPNDFAIFVKGLPSDFRDESELAKFFEDYSALWTSEDKATVIDVVIGYDIREFSKIAARKAHLIQLIDDIENPDEYDGCKLCWTRVSDWCCRVWCCKRQYSSADLDVLKQELKEIEVEEANHQQMSSTSLECSGYAIVVFERQTDLRRCLENWTESYKAHLEAITLGLYQQDTPLFRNECHLRVDRAANPSEILWANLGTSKKKRILATATTVLAGAAILILSAMAIYGLTQANKIIRDDFDTASFWGWVLSLIPGLVISGLNSVIRMVLAYMTVFECHSTRTDFDSSVLIKVTIALISNSSMIYLFLNQDPYDWYSTGGLVENVFLQLTYGLWMTPAFKIFEYMIILRRLYAWRIDEENTTMPQEKYNRLYEGVEFGADYRYAYQLNYFIITVIYMPIFPILSLLMLVILFINYWTDKWSLLNLIARPYVQGETLSRTALMLVRVLCCLSPGLGLMFLPPSFSKDYHAAILICCFVGLGFTIGLAIFVPIQIQEKVLLTERIQPSIDVGADEFEDEPDYYKAQCTFLSPYHKANPVYAVLPEEVNPLFIQPPHENGGVLGSVRINRIKGAAVQFDLKAAMAMYKKEINDEAKTEMIQQLHHAGSLHLIGTPGQTTQSPNSAAGTLTPIDTIAPYSNGSATNPPESNVPLYLPAGSQSPNTLRSSQSPAAGSPANIEPPPHVIGSPTPPGNPPR